MTENDARIAQLQAEVDQTRSKRNQLLAKVAQAEQLIDGRDQRIVGLKSDITDYEAQVSNLELKVQETSIQIQHSKESLGKMIRNSLKINANNGLQVMLQHTDPAVSSRLGVYYDHFFRAQKTVIAEATEQLGVIESAHYEAVKSRNWLLHLKKKATGQRQQLTARKKSRGSSVAALDSSIEESLKSVETLTREQAELTKLAEALRSNALGSSGFFEAGKGQYPWPIKGHLAAKFGSTKSVGKLKWTGILIESAEGNVVKCIADGEIVYADWLQGFGMLVIVDHGDGYMTLYGGNRELSVNQGDWVEFGATIATVGDSVGQKQSGLYFEIRHNAKPINPESWIDPKNRFETADNKG